MSNQTKKPPMGGMGPGKGPMTMEKAKDFKAVSYTHLTLPTN